MLKKFMLRPWLNLAETAEELSSGFGEEITIADVLRYALDGHLSLSVKLSGQVHACRAGEMKIATGIKENCAVEYKFNKDEALQVSTVVEEISGIFTIVMVGYGRYRIQEEYSALADTAPTGQTDLLNALAIMHFTILRP